MISTPIHSYYLLRSSLLKLSICIYSLDHHYFSGISWISLTLGSICRELFFWRCHTSLNLHVSCVPTLMSASLPGKMVSPGRGPGEDVATIYSYNNLLCTQLFVVFYGEKTCIQN